MLTPFLICYADSSIDRASKDQFSIQICGFYEEFLKKIYFGVGVKSEEQNYFQRYQSEIRNITACYIRLKSQDDSMQNIDENSDEEAEEDVYDQAENEQYAKNEDTFSRSSSE